MNSDNIFNKELHLTITLEKSLKLKTEINACAEDLRKANTALKEKIRQLTDEITANILLSSAEIVREKLRVCADDLEQVRLSIASAAEKMKRLELELETSNRLLLNVNIALESAIAERDSAEVMAFNDPLTGLPNRTLFTNRLTQAIEMASRHGWPLAVMFLDLDFFKMVNDTYGHEFGDRVLKRMATHLNDNSRDEDTVCRQGGDEFLCLYINPGDHASILKKAQSIRAQIGASEHYDPLHVDLQVKVSIGISVFPDHGITAIDLIRNADAAMYQAKLGKTDIAFYENPA